MDDSREPTTIRVREPGFEGELTISGGTLRVTGTRPQDGAAVVKDVPTDRDPELAALVQRVVSGEEKAAGALLSHVGVLDPV